MLLGPAGTQSVPQTWRTQGARAKYTTSRIVPAEPLDHAIGRSRGGRPHPLGPLVHACVAPLTAGQDGDNPLLIPLIEVLGQAGHGLGFRPLADKAFSHLSTR